MILESDLKAADESAAGMSADRATWLDRFPNHRREIKPRRQWVPWLAALAFAGLIVVFAVLT